MFRSHFLDVSEDRTELGLTDVRTGRAENCSALFSPRGDVGNKLSFTLFLRKCLKYPLFSRGFEQNCKSAITCFRGEVRGLDILDRLAN